MTKVLVTGANGFIGKNLCVRLSELKEIEIVTFSHTTPVEELPALLKNVEVIFHLAGVNRPQHPSELAEGNNEFTTHLCNAVRNAEQKISILYSSSKQATQSNEYGVSKAQAEAALKALADDGKTNVLAYRLPNVFGKWSRPNYNSAIATFCYNVVHSIPLTIHDENSPLQLVYVDDVVDEFISVMQERDSYLGFQYKNISTNYETTVGEVARQIRAFPNNRETGIIDRVGTGLTRALYATYLSYLPPAEFKYGLQKHADPRGVFVEMLKTRDSGQFSFFTAYPGITRGGHYHHTKTEKFLVIKGKASFKFRHVVTDEFFELLTDADVLEVVETIPGWAHDITNIGEDEMVVMLWANEIFDRERPDTVGYKI
jgi:UDP-2-acetamido-2,6-beta-L-arabino-hexul-4-ose reductase